MSRDEYTRLKLGAELGEAPGGLGSVRFVIACNANAAGVLSRAKEVLEVVLEQDTNQWPPLEVWKHILPKWFVEKCQPELSKEEILEQLKEHKRVAQEERESLDGRESWTLSGWLHWFLPDYRHWYWWDAVVDSPFTIQVAIEAHEWPFPWGSLTWLFRAAGAEKVSSEQ